MARQRLISVMVQSVRRHDLILSSDKHAMSIGLQIDNLLAEYKGQDDITPTRLLLDLRQPESEGFDEHTL